MPWQPKAFPQSLESSSVWIEDLYMKPESRGLGIGSKFFEYIEEKYADVVVRLEVEEENERAVHVYKKAGYEVLPYMEMIRK